MRNRHVVVEDGVAHLIFEGFEIDGDGGRVLRAGAVVVLEPRALELLCYLAQNPGRLISKDELLERVWNAHALSDGVLANTIAKLRRALGQDARAGTPIETVHGRGYRFHAVRAMTALEPFVGREAVSQLLDDSLERASAGTSQLVLISGEAGIGKSRTLRELATRARGHGFQVWSGAAYAGGGAPAYWPWIEVVRSALDDSRPRDHLPADGWAIASLVPERLEVPPMAAPSDAAELRFRLFDELRRWLEAASRDAALLIALEDMHWANAASIKLLSQLASAQGQRRVLLAATWRETESKQKPDQLGLLLRDAQHVELRGLSPQEVSELSGRLGHPVPDAGTAELLYARTQGNPFFLRQALQLLQQRGRQLTAASLQASEWPAAVREAIEQRLAGLSTPIRAQLAAAAAIGQKFDADLLACLLGQPLTATLAALDPALQLGLVRQLDGQSRHFELVHALVGEALYEGLGLVERGALHARLARLLAQRAAMSDPQLLGEVARHSLLAVPFDLDAYVRDCRRAADAARARYGFEAAAELLQRALQKLAAEPPTELQYELRLQRAFDLFAAGQLTSARRELQEAALRARAEDSAPWLARFVAQECSWLEIGGQTLDRAEALDDALNRLDGSQPALRASLLARRAALGSDLPRAQRDALFEEAEQLAAASGDTSAELDVASARAHARDPARVDDCRRAIDRFRALSARALPSDLQQQGRHVMVELSEYWCAVVRGDLVLADLAISQVEVAASVTCAPALQVVCAMMRAMRALGDGRLDDMATYVARMRASSSGLADSSTGVAWVYCNLLLAEARADESVFAQLAAGVDLSLLGQLTPEQVVNGIALRARLAVRLGQPEIARNLLARVPSQELDRARECYGALGLLCSLAEVYWQLGDVGPAQQLYEQLLPHASLNAVGMGFEYKGSVSQYLGMLALMLGERENAREHLRFALAFNERLGMPLEVTRARALLERAPS